MARPAGPEHPRGYPYATGRLAPDWGNRRAQALALAAIVAAALAAAKRSSLALAAADELALFLVFPMLLAIVLAFAPRPATRLGQIAKDFTVVAMIASIFAGGLVPLMVGGFPLLLAASALFSRTRLAHHLWPAPP